MLTDCKRKKKKKTIKKITRTVRLSFLELIITAERNLETNAQRKQTKQNPNKQKLSLSVVCDTKKTEQNKVTKKTASVLKTGVSV